MTSDNDQRMKKLTVVFTFEFFHILLLLRTAYSSRSVPACNISEIWLPSLMCGLDESPKYFYILYDVNPVEGFNLRRDVYIRIAVFVKNLREDSRFKNTKLVLPPFPRLYHWKSSYLEQNQVFWNEFFDIASLKRYVSVLDFWEFFSEVQKSNPQHKEFSVDYAFKLQHFENMFENGVFIDKFEIKHCRKAGIHPGSYFGYENITQKMFQCLKFQGNAELLKSVVLNSFEAQAFEGKSVLLLNSEIVLHDHWGDTEFWRARRSMRFAHKLVNVATEFRERVFNSTDEYDGIQRPIDWIYEKPYRGAKGGNYLCAHLRRGDFMHGREKTTPTLKSTANQIKNQLNLLNLDKVFIASDCNKFEYKNLKSYLGRAKAYRFSPESLEQKADIKDGGIAIIDQIICSHARHFIGTFESTFTYRIYEEREILGFRKERTFNSFCKNEDLSDCEKTSVWPIVY